MWDHDMTMISFKRIFILEWAICGINFNKQHISNESIEMSIYYFCILNKFNSYIQLIL